ncbi:MAG: hypothetical protein JKY37_13820 [Nannocystaceae bacterium]|nr:hypothetical protein [Nannocystaceae bacterium]
MSSVSLSVYPWVAMHWLSRSLFLAGGALALSIACDGGTTAKGQRDQAAIDKVATDKAEEKKAAAAKVAEDAKRAEQEKQAEQARRDTAYEAAKGAIEPLAKLPKKHPKGFANACIEMLAAYDPFMKQSLEGDAVAQWDAGTKTRERVMRRACHVRPVDAVVCETAVLKKAPPDTEFEHIVRLCTEKFAG